MGTRLAVALLLLLATAASAVCVPSHEKKAELKAGAAAAAAESKHGTEPAGAAPSVKKYNFDSGVTTFSVGENLPAMKKKDGEMVPRSMEEEVPEDAEAADESMVAAHAAEKQDAYKSVSSEEDGAVKKKSKSKSSEDDDDEKKKKKKKKKKKSKSKSSEEEGDDDEEDKKKKKKSKSKNPYDDKEEKSKKKSKKSKDSDEDDDDAKKKAKKSKKSSGDGGESEKKPKIKDFVDAATKKLKSKTSPMVSSKPMEQPSPVEPSPAADVPAYPSPSASVSSKPMEQPTPVEPSPAADVPAYPSPSASVSSKPMEEETPDAAAGGGGGAYETETPKKPPLKLQSLPGEMLPNPVDLTRLSPFVKSMCEKTDHPELCESTIGKLPENPPATAPVDGAEMLKLAIDAVRAKVSEALTKATGLSSDPNMSPMAKKVVGDCIALYKAMDDDFDDAEAAIKVGDHDKAHSMLDSAHTDVDTCENGFEEREELLPLMSVHDNVLAGLSSNALAIAKATGQ